MAHGAPRGAVALLRVALHAGARATVSGSDGLRACARERGRPGEVRQARARRAEDLSAELATAMLRSVAPDVTILHIESHTNGADGRGKGCAWAYVNSVEDAMRVTAHADFYSGQPQHVPHCQRGIFPQMFFKQTIRAFQSAQRVQRQPLCAGAICWV